MGVITKVSEITKEYLGEYLRLDDPSADQLDELATMLGSAKGFVSSYTGLPITSGEGLNLDSKPEFVVAVCVLVQNSYDNRTLYVDKGEAEKVLEATLDMHVVNLL